MIRLFGFLLLAAGLLTTFGPGYLDIGLLDGDLQPIGFILIAIGGVMFLLGGRRRRKQRGEESVQRVSKTSSIGYRQPEPEPEDRKPDITWGRKGDDD